MLASSGIEVLLKESNDRVHSSFAIIDRVVMA